MHYVIEPIRPLEEATVRYTIEAKGSSLTIRAFATGLLSAFAHNPTITAPDLEGEIFLDADAVEQSSLRVVVHSASLADSDDVSEQDREEINRRMHEEVLDSDSFPDVVYECSKGSASRIGDGQYWLALNGTLTLRGVKRNQPVSVHVSLNGNALNAAGDFSIRLSDYEIQPVTAVGGTVRLKDEVKIAFAISARKP